MLLSSREPPSSLSLRKTPTRSTFPETSSSQHNLRIPLVDSPLPSPGLPFLAAPPKGKKFQPRWNRRIRRLLFYISALIVVFILIKRVVAFLLSSQFVDVVDFVPTGRDAYEIVGTETLPEQPIPIAITGLEGKPKWTVSIPQDLDFPLTPKEYARLCSQCEEISRSVAEMAGRSPQGHSHSYYQKDPGFVDISDAAKQGLLPPLDEGQQKADSRKTQEDAAVGSHSNNQVCKKSLTYVLQSEEAGLGKTLWGLWMSYGLAQKEGRSFFIDDTNWAYGNYTSYFQPPPKPDCLPPPPRERVPCPHEARHLVVSMATAPWTFGDSFQKQFTDRSKTGVERHRHIFSLLRAGYESLFKLADEDMSYSKSRSDELKSAVQSHGGKQVGIHVRRGDLHPREFQYQDSYIPLEQYREAAERILERSLTATHDQHSMNEARTASKLILASDDPDVYDNTEFSGAEKAQHLISLATKKTLDQASASQGQAKKSSIDDNIGWEGGFFKDMFWSLGLSYTRRAGPPASKRHLGHFLHLQEHVSDSENNHHAAGNDNALYLRKFIGRAYLLDLAVLGQTDMVVCGVSSMTCRLLAVILGWDKAIKESAWQNIDGGGHWDGMLW
ncbi:hypothetical protein DTO166G4_6879 [Paecilomyces variotii]|nr:hypothetical protein DTO166G4_6879 [Paecilomyces variotii]KAJ9218655.1 hypothetical protein DTO169C6_9008 [Paecilomyces variotii]KAJ9232010.1 hypothetical protein DTO166G5_6461 [Paecilomyces variotii]KAJ9246515.1 hypothetical protein DTO207G8_8869 [Paecilomyces variotii]KAJ9264454.1 hypothetical protein DTO195F2_2271 [Paecilomyces variotii]